MDPVWGEIARYSMWGVIGYTGIKYFIGPMVNGLYSNKEMVGMAKDVAETTFLTFERVYSKTVEERAKLTVELAKIGKSKEEISDYLDASLPFPEEPELKLNLVGSREEEE